MFLLQQNSREEVHIFSLGIDQLSMRVYIFTQF